MAGNRGNLSNAIALILKQPIQAVRDADLLMAVLDGYNVDDAVAVQIGAFHAHARGSRAPPTDYWYLATRASRVGIGRRRPRAIVADSNKYLELGAIYPNFKKAFDALGSYS